MEYKFNEDQIFIIKWCLEIQESIWSKSKSSREYYDADLSRLNECLKIIENKIWINNYNKGKNKMQYKKENKTNKNCPKCSSKLYEETVKEIDYPYVCLKCDENFYNFEINE